MINRSLFFKRIALLVLSAVLLVSVAIGEGAPDSGQPASLIIHYHSGDSALASVPFDIYKVAAVSSSMHFSLLSPFENAPVSLDGQLNQESWKMIAAALQKYITENSLSPLLTLTTDSNGEASASNLTPGLYLVRGRSVELNWKQYTPEAAMVLLPTISPNKEWQYDVEMFPKPEIIEIPKTSRRVIKVWNDGNQTSLRPNAISVELLRDQTVYETADLSSANHWSFYWEELDDRYQWSIREKIVPKGYTSKVTQTGNQFIITNTLTATETPIPEENLPQTGLLWWPVPALTLSGMCLFLIGWVRQRKNK